jgi:hypothetical protein
MAATSDIEIDIRRSDVSITSPQQGLISFDDIADLASFVPENRASRIARSAAVPGDQRKIVPLPE